MSIRLGSVCSAALALTIITGAAAVGLKGAAQTAEATFKVAYYNIQSGMGATQLAGSCPFERNSNCVDPSRPMNAWGTGVVQAELERAVNADPQVIALGLSEAWPCATPAAVRSALGWAAHTGERNGVSLLARHGFAGPAEWFQLDTSLNSNPNDTMWVVRAPVCGDAACSRSVEVFSAHWYASGETRTESYERQARGTVAFMDRLPDGEPRVLVGDLNVWDEGGPVCSQTPVPTAVQILRDAGYVDAWPSVHGTAEGYTAIWNRNGCGVPNGNLWKRIDYAWSAALPAPVSMTRFGMVAPGSCAPSDHAGIIAEYPWPGSQPPSNSPPLASFTVSCAGPDCAFSDHSSDAEGPIADWSWTFGDGTTSATGSPAHHYEVAGTYSVALTVTDGDGDTSTDVQNVIVSAPETFNFSLSASPAAKTVRAGARANYTVSSTVTGGVAANVALTVSGLPAGASAVFAPASIPGTGSSTLAIDTAKSTPAGSYGLTIVGTGGATSRTVTVRLDVVGRR